jgi:hypothetical protein
MKLRLLFFAAVVAASLLSVPARANCVLQELHTFDPLPTAEGTETITQYRFDCEGVSYWVVVTITQ